MSLKDLQQYLLSDIQSSSAGRRVGVRLHRIFEHSIIPEVKASMKAELSSKSYERSKCRIPDVNIVRQITNKLAKVYDKDAIRKTKNKTDQSLIEYYERETSLDHKMRTANAILELLKTFALEPYIGTDGPEVRVLAPYQFHVLSTDKDNPNRMTVFTKFMPDKVIIVDTGYGKQEKVIQVFRSYTDSEIMDWDSEGKISSIQSNPAGLIPFIYGNPSEFELAPQPLEEEIETALLIPKAYTDLHYALKFTCHSVTVAMDCEIPADATWAPDAFIEVKTDADAADSGKRGSIETIKPTADIEKALALISDTVSSVLESRGIKSPNVNRNVERPNAAAAMIEDADASSHIKRRCAFFQNIETAFWDLIASLHNTIWLNNPLVEEKAKFSDSLEVEVQFAEIKPVEIRSELVARLDAQMKAGLMTPLQALEELYPSFTLDQLEERLKQVKEHATNSAVARVPDGRPTPGSGPADNQNNPGANASGSQP